MKKVPVRRSIVLLKAFRRISQAAFLVLFLFYSSEWFFHFDPFAALITLISSHSVYASMIWSIVVIALTALLGRVFCGWVCPLGSAQAVAAWIFPVKNKKRLAGLNSKSTKRRLKYLILFFALGAAVMGSSIGGILDPLAVTLRGFVFSWLPALSSALDRAGQAMADSDSLSGLAGGLFFMSSMLDPSGRSAEMARYNNGWIFGLILVLILAAAVRWPRWWCRNLCPLGALLGLFSRFSLLGMSKNTHACTDCGLCLRHCNGACGPDGNSTWLKAECHMCFNCENACPEGVINFGFNYPAKDADPLPVDLSRRRVISSAVLGMALPPVLRAGDAAGVDTRPHPGRIRPPGSLEEKEFIERCIRCGRCIDVCPYNALHPALYEAGAEGLWTPVVIPRIGPCEASCTSCSQHCPTGAIRLLSPETRTGLKTNRPVKIGTAFIDRGRCLPWAMETPCVVCEEFCPVSPKAIKGENVITAGVHGESVEVRRPHVDPRKCIGCGACEHACPVHDKAAIRVSSAGETRSSSNVLLLDKPEQGK